MSELKAYKAYNRWIDEEMPTPNDDLICNEVYLKSEADKVIAEKDKTISEMKKACNSKDEWCLHTLKENRHQKYKRCLAMVKYCHESAMWLEEYGVIKYATFMLRWQKRWLELAEKFKEVK